jgi:hypothetical protein
LPPEEITPPPVSMRDQLRVELAEIHREVDPLDPIRLLERGAHRAAAVLLLEVHVPSRSSTPTSSLIAASVT